MTPYNLKFITCNDSFHIELGDGRWCRKLQPEHKDYDSVGKNGNDSSVVYIGSINPKLSSAYSSENGWSQEKLKREIFVGTISGLTNSFIEDYHPLGVICLPGEVIADKSGRLFFSDNSIKKSLEVRVGGPIKEVL